MSDRLRVSHQLREIFYISKEVVKFLGMLPFTCGYVMIDGEKLQYHDHSTLGNVGGRVDGYHVWNRIKKRNEPYDRDVHGPINDYIQEGSRIPGVPKSRDGRYPIHRHDGSNTHGPFEFDYEVRDDSR